MKAIIIIAVILAAYIFIFRLMRFTRPPECQKCGRPLAKDQEECECGEHTNAQSNKNT